MIKLTDEEIDEAVNDWVNGDWSVRSIQLDRGHWEYVAPVIAKAQLKKVVEWLRVSGIWEFIEREEWQALLEEVKE